MAVTRITNTAVLTAVCPPGKKKIALFDDALTGFICEIAPHRRTYALRYTDERGKQIQYKIGDASVLTAEQARKVAQRVKAQSLIGESPQAERKVKVLQALPRFDGCPYVVPNVKTMKPHGSIFTSWNQARRRAGLADVRIHDCRHTLASHLAMSGHSLLIIAKVLGHQNTRTTERYAHVSNEALRDAVNTAARVSGTTLATSAE